VKQKLAFYGNNLNTGYFFVRALRELGIEGKLFSIEYPYQQEHHNWWTNEKLDHGLVRIFKTHGFDVGVEGRLDALSEIRDLYKEVTAYDVLVMMEDGPAVFSELQNIQKVFLSGGSDLQILPFLTQTHYPLSGLLATVLRDIGRALTGNLLAIPESRQYFAQRAIAFRIQARQRRGLRQCSSLFCSSHQRALVDRLQLDPRKVHYLSLPAYASVLSEVDRSLISTLKRRYADIDILFVHPARQLYLNLNNDKFLKDNDKLLHAYAHFVKGTRKKVKLLLVRKGREKDIQSSETFIKQLKLEDFVEWLPELPNKALRAYYSLPAAVVCDQYNPNLAILGSIGREATFFGRYLITAFADWNRLAYGDDLPPNVLAAQTVEEILTAMEKVASLTREERETGATAASQWFQRHLDSRTVIPRILGALGIGLA
jgi:hypothetical protein